LAAIHGFRLDQIAVEHKHCQFPHPATPSGSTSEVLPRLASTSPCIFQEHFYASRISTSERCAGWALVRVELTMATPREQEPSASGRRGFIKRLLAGAIGAVLGLVPAAASLKFFLDPLRRKSSVGEAVRVASLDALPADGVPRKFPVIADREDAWNKFANVPVGAVYLRRTPEGQLAAFNVVCPHAGCFVDFKPESGNFLCPCHDSLFTVDGKVANPASPAARPLDSLEIELRNEKEIWVRFQNYEAGKAQKIPVA
jgi:menaquinol-cytochrome c reductase iron-sulfur subunit